MISIYKCCIKLLIKQLIAYKIINWIYILGSVPSLGAGLVFGTFLAYGAFQVSRDPSNYSTQLVTSSILAGAMGYRFYNSGKIMPAGLVCAISVAMIMRIAFNAAKISTRKITGS